MLHDLMPLQAEAPRCSDFARSIELRPPGTGLYLQRAVLVAIPLPWPKPALRHESLTAAAPFVVDSAVSSRLFAMEPFESAANIEVYERRGGEAVRYQWSVASPDHFAATIQAITATAVGELANAELEHATLLDSGPAPATVLVCTQGSHDFCCGDSGVRFADQVSTMRPECEVRRVSHTGGHRFSPTLLAFPQGRMWAFADIELVDRILAGTETADDFETRSRGWWGAKVGAAQVAETAVRSELAERSATAPADGDVELVTDEDDVKQYAVRVGAEAWQVDVTVGRVVPSIACESPGGLPAKPGREFSWKMSDQGDRDE